MKILIADDEPTFRHLLEEMVTSWGYEVVVTNDGNEALQLLLSVDAPRLAILDWLMPGMDGLELCRRIRKEANGAYIYIILLTAQQKDEDLVAGMDAGADDYITKPLKINELRVRLNAGRRIVDLQNELAAHAAELEAANRDLEAFSYTVSNNLLKSLLAIGSNARKIEDNICKKEDEPCLSYAKRIYDKTKHLGKLIGIMNDYFRPMRIEFHRETIDLSEIVTKITEKLRITDPERRVTFRIADGIKVNADRNLLQMAMDNLLGNAWKHTGKREDAVIEFGIKEVKGVQACFVRDNGSGFAMTYANKLFVPFQQLPGTEDYRGDGIGLATVERIIRRHGGKVWAEGAPDRGATFWFTVQQ